MGYGSYSASDWQKLKASRQFSTTDTVTEVFKKTQCDPRFDPRYIGTRECFDSEDHPQTTPIVVGLDVTGSMGYLAVKVATEALNDLIMKLYSTDSVEDPALLCAAYGDFRDRSPLQVTQFESDIRIAEQLLDLYFEDGGQGQVALSCLWEFLARHTNIDAVNKRKEKGFLFTIGDNAPIRTDHVRETVQKVTGDVVFDDASQLLNEVERKFHVFHIMLGGDGNGAILKGRKITLDRGNIDIIPELIISVIQLQKGVNLDKILKQWDEIKRPSLENALRQLKLTNTGRGILL